ncbi:MAG: iron-only hydrogenase system regulator [Spirochaetes bacterium]|nr:iron-only hydrogenase system regulator [Spirochaetota bacterium]
MEKRLGVIAVLVKKRDHVDILNSIFSSYNEIILGRQGIPLRDKGIQVISLIVEGTNDQISALTGKIGKLEGIQVKSVLTTYKENTDEDKSAG